MFTSLHVPDFSTARILVAGDLMLDRYWYGATQRISPEAPVPVVRVEQEEHRPGGAANVAVNIAALMGQVHLLGLIGADEQGRILKLLLQQRGVKCCFEEQNGFPTITKLRVISRHQQLLRMDFEGGFSPTAGEILYELFLQNLNWANVIVLSDYAKGTLRNMQRLIDSAHQANKLVLVDPKRQDFSAYSGADVVTPNMAELEAAVGPCPTENLLIEKGIALLSEHELGALLITRGELGMTLLQPNEYPKHLPTHAQEVYDVTGAGDTVISVLAAGLGAGLPLIQATQLANYAAGIVVGKLGTATVSLSELEQAINSDKTANVIVPKVKKSGEVVTELELLALAHIARVNGESLVFTNGCFDILHAGHVEYLEEASRLGDRLIVAVNVDQTIRALKGPNRPIMPLQQRLRVLAALACVDWVVAFSESTPERLICAVQPDFLVKGGDNDPDRIPGANCVRQAGGQVLTLSYLTNCSTTNIVNTIRSTLQNINLHH